MAQACHAPAPGTVRQMIAEDVLAVLRRAAGAVQAALAGTDEWGLAGTIPGQHASDLVADEAACTVLDEAGMGVLSEESGVRNDDRALLVVLDPLDGSSNAARGLSWWATSLCALDAEGPLAAVVVDLVHGRRYEATRGGGATCDGEVIRPSGAARLGDAMVGLSGWPAQNLGWRQYRALGASALDLCAVADGRLDGFVDCSRDAHGPWDYLGALLVCQEAGAVMADALGRELVLREHGPRRTPVAAATPALLDELLSARAAATAG
jgi:fructose-1,6-bisphosphatase/inositol monophosphatase family enzyme